MRQPQLPPRQRYDEAMRCALWSDDTHVTLVHDEEAARLARLHNDANVLVLGARRIEPSVAEDCLHAFLTTPFEGGGRHERRVRKLA